MLPMTAAILKFFLTQNMLLLSLFFGVKSMLKTLQKNVYSLASSLLPP